MSRYHCWIPEQGEAELDGLPYDANAPEYAAQAYARYSDEQVGEGCDGVSIVHARGPDGVVVKLRVRGWLEPTYEAEVIGTVEAT